MAAKKKKGAWDAREQNRQTKKIESKKDNFTGGIRPATVRTGHK